MKAFTPRELKLLLINLLVFGLGLFVIKCTDVEAKDVFVALIEFYTMEVGYLLGKGKTDA